MVPYLYPAPPPSSPTTGFGSWSSNATSSFFSTLPTNFDGSERGRGFVNSSSISGCSTHLDVSLHYNQSMRRNSLGLEEDDAERRTDGMEQDSFASTSTSYSSPPLVPFSFPPRNTAPRKASDCPSSPPLVALSFNTYSFPTPSTSELVQRPQRPVPHPLISTSKLRLEMTPLPAFHLPLPDVEMSPPWSTLDVGSLAPDVPPKARKNSLVSLPVAPPTPPLTPNEELPNFDWKEVGRNETRGRSRQVTPLAKRRRYN